MFDFFALREDSAAAVESLLEWLNPRMEQGLLTRETKELCQHFHLIAVATLLLDGDAQHFGLNLCRAAENWRRFLLHTQAQGWPLPPATWNIPLLGAVAAGQWKLAREMARLSEFSPWQDKGEYEDDYCWSLILQQLIHDGHRSHLPALMERLEALNGDDAPWRLGLARGLATFDERGFLDAFTLAHENHEAITEEQASSFTTPVTRFAAHRYIWMEGLALLRLGERAGFTGLAGDYRYCPPLARLPLRAPYAEEDWVIPIGT